MFTDLMHADLYEIAGHVGPLDQEAVSGAKLLLAQPRYATSESGEQLLVDDLKRVIAGIPADTDPSEDEAKPSASRYFRAYARRYFSLDEVGANISHRRAFGRKNVNGSEVAWMNRAVVYRVAAGLLELWADASKADTGEGRETATGLSYRIDSVTATRYIESSWLFPTRDVLEYDLHLLAPGPHILVLPFPKWQTTLSVLSTEGAVGNPKPQLVPVAGEEVELAALLFGAQQQPGEQVRVEVQHRPIRNRKYHPEHGISSRYLVSQPVGQLTLRVSPRDSRDYRWQISALEPIASNSKIIDTPSSPWWRCENPNVESGYILSGRL